ncbi:MAG TPA: OsmC family protein [Bacteroidia bacterium]|jgi:putative redox protein|nr:OsmC family protein [Bacteroidia bacterium]HWY97440.1 OsmC family protein [Bacteroidia bacterium]
MAKITLHRVDNDFLLEAKNVVGSTIKMDGNPEIGGHNLGMRPLETMIAALGGCSSIDVIMILKKQRQQIDSYDVEIEYERDQKQEPALITQIHVKFIIKGKVDEDKLQKAIELSLEKYCTVAKMLEKTAKITSSYQIN